MRLLLVTIGSRGDIQPFIPLALGLQTAGYTVRIATHGPYEEFVRGYGLDFAPVVGDPQAIISGDSGLDWLETGRNPLMFLQRMRDLVGTMMQDMGRDVLAAADGMDAILFSVLGYFPAAPIAEKLGIPSIGLHLQPVHPTREFPGIMFPNLPANLPLQNVYNRFTHNLGLDLNWWLFKPSFNAMRTTALSLPPERTPFRTQMSRPYPVIHGFSRHVVPRPADWGDNLKLSGYWFLDDTDWEPPSALLDFLAAGRKPVYLGFGSMTNRDAEKVTNIMLAAVRQSGERAVLLSGWAGIGNSDLPDTIYKIDNAPHSWLFPRMAAVVHHGGAGTTAAGLRAGVPSVLIPHFADQPFWGWRVRALGVGPDFIPQQRLTANKLAHAMHVAATNNGLQQRAAALGTKIRAEDGVGTAVRYIETALERSTIG